MASYGLLGAIGGLGQALQTTGQGLEQRRQRALEQARRDAEYQRQRADRTEDRNVEFQNRRDLAEFGEERRDLRARDAAKDTAQRTEADREFRRSERLERQAFTEEREEDRQNHAEQLTRLRAALTRDNTVNGIRLRDQLSQDNVRGIVYGPINQQGMSEAIIVRQDGTTQPTGRFVQRRVPTMVDEDDDDPLD